MPRFKRGRRRGGFRRARSFIRKTVSSMGPIERKVLLAESLTVPAITSAAYDNPLSYSLFVCQEATDEELESDGTNIAQIPLYSKVIALKTAFTVTGMASGDRVRWLLYKDEDGENVVTDLTDAFFHNANDTPTARSLREHTLAKGILHGSDRTSARVPIFIRRSTLKRLGNCRESDRWRLIIANSGSTATIRLSGFGTLYARMH